MLLSVVVDMELVHLDGWQSCWTVGLCEERWSCWTWRLVWSRRADVVEHGDLCEVWRANVVQLGELSRSGVVVLRLWSHNGKRCWKSPSSLSTQCRVVLVRISIISDNSSAAAWRINRHILKFLLFMGVSPNFDWAPPNFGWNEEVCLFKLFVLSFIKGFDSFLSSVERFEIFKVSYVSYRFNIQVYLMSYRSPLMIMS